MSQDRPPVPLAAAETPAVVNVAAGRQYTWCRCGLSRRQPFCDGSHAGTGLEPLAWRAARTETLWLCRCKRTGSPPLCDGSHRREAPAP